MYRRQFLKYGVFGAAAALAPQMAWAQTSTTSREFKLRIEPVDAELIDGSVVYMLIFEQQSNSGDPRPILRVLQGDSITITVKNNDQEPHGFAIRGVGAASIPLIEPGAEATVTFTAPQGGTYLYLDPTKAPLNRLLGLHGAFVSVPRQGVTKKGAPIPYSPVSQTLAAQALFEALGMPPRFPGKRWNPSDPNRQSVWVWNQIDPTLNAAADAGQTINLAGIKDRFVPRYFTINGRSGFDLHDDVDTCPHGYVGEPCLIRTLNAGLCTHSPHIHGNHIMEVARSKAGGGVGVLDNIYERDSWKLGPLDVVDVLLPFEKPPDIPSSKWPPKEEPFPMRYVMHCHTEMSQTAGGGNYPQGCVIHWELMGPLRT